jgi:uncharacterized protein (TIGR04552 family)
VTTAPPERPPLHIDATLLSALGGRALDLADVASVRLMLKGDSVIDWNRSFFRDLADVDRFLGLHLLDVHNHDDLRRLAYVHREAVVYLAEHLGITSPPDLEHPEDLRQVFLLASQTGGFRRRQILACVILKLMHVINHMESAELRFQTPLSEANVLDLADARIRAASVRMREEGFPLVSFYGSRKTRHSVITKLIAKKENTAATVFDKLRFRIVTKEQHQIFPALAWLARNLFPFNYVIPGQSHNNLVSLRDMLTHAPYEDVVASLSEGEDAALSPEANPFSGGSYRMVNFIVDMPVRVDHLVDRAFNPMYGRTVFAMVEFQVLDEATAEANESGENAHHLYKERQRAIVQKRLKKGGRWRRAGRT